MTTVEFRNKSSLRHDQDQMTLPFSSGPNREVHWLHGVKERRRFLGKRAAAGSVELVIAEGSCFPKTTFMDAKDIGELTDPKLRYALRLADAANAVGWTSDGTDSKSAHDVTVVATDEGINSQLLEASYTGVVKRGVDTFIQNLQTAAPEQSQPFKN